MMVGKIVILGRQQSGNKIVWDFINADWAAAHFSGQHLVGKYTELLHSVVEEAVAHDLADARAEVAH